MGDSKINKEHVFRKKCSPPPHPREPERRNCPHPFNSRFLRSNARLLNEPICVMATNDTDHEQMRWWPSKVPNGSLAVPEVSKDTTQRVDYVRHKVVKSNTRHFSNPLSVPSKGITPVNIPKKECDPGEHLLEKISYAHSWDSRKDPPQPTRGKLHGTFIWDRVVKDQCGKEVIESPWNKRDIARCMKTNVVPVTSNEAKQTTQSIPGPATSHEVVKPPASNLIPSIEGIPSL